MEEQVIRFPMDHKSPHESKKICIIWVPKWMIHSENIPKFVKSGIIR